MALAREESSPLFAGTVAGTLRLILYLALAMVLMVLDHRNGWIWRLRYATSVLVEPVYRLASLPASGMHTLSVAFSDRKMLTEQNQRLREDLLLANAKLNRMAAVAEQNERLKQLLDTQHSLDLNVQLARVINVDLGAYRHRMLVNVGSHDGVKAGQVVIERTGLRTVAYGTRDGDLLSLPNISMASDVHPGDKLLSSGLGGRFPPGFPVGEIRSVEPAASGLFLEGRARPAADLDRSDNVLILHDLAEPAGPPAPAAEVGPPADLAPAPAPAASVAPPPRASVTPASPSTTNTPVQP